VTCVEKRGTLGGTCLNVGCIPSKALLNNSHLYHQILHDTKGRGIEVGDVKLNLQQMMKSKDTAVSGLTKGVEFLFKKNNVEYVKGTAAFTGEHEVKVNLTDGGEQTILAKNILIATGSEATPFPGLTVDEKRIITSTGAIALEKVPETMVVIGGGIIGLEMGSVWSRLGSKVTVVEFLGQIGGPGMDSEIAKSSQKILKKQGIDFKLNTKVLSGDSSGEKIKLEVEASKGGKPETVSKNTLHHENHLCLQKRSSKRMLCLWLLAVGHTLLALGWRISVLRLMRRAELSLTLSIGPKYLIFDV
jgi:dihydrolipoamide dehydrogenase